MVSLYNLQISLINAHGQNTMSNPHQLITQIRPRFKKLWEDIRAFLQMNYAIGGDIITLQESLGTESAEDCMEFLIEIGGKSTQLLELSSTLASDAINLTEDFLNLVPEFEKTLLNSITPVNRTNFGQYQSETLAQEARLIYFGAGHPRMNVLIDLRPIADAGPSQIVMQGSGSNAPLSWSAAKQTRRLKPSLKPALPPFILMARRPSTIPSLR